MMRVEVGHRGPIAYRERKHGAPSGAAALGARHARSQKEQTPQRKLRGLFFSGLAPGGLLEQGESRMTVCRAPEVEITADRAEAARPPTIRALMI
jgi:hypothetical protein